MPTSPNSAQKSPGRRRDRIRRSSPSRRAPGPDTCPHQAQRCNSWPEADVRSGIRLASARCALQIDAVQCGRLAQVTHLLPQTSDRRVPRASIPAVGALATRWCFQRTLRNARPFEIPRGRSVSTRTITRIHPICGRPMTRPSALNFSPTPATSASVTTPRKTAATADRRTREDQQDGPESEQRVDGCVETNEHAAEPREPHGRSANYVGSDAARIVSRDE